MVPVDEDTSARVAAATLAEHGFAALPVLTGDRQLLGVLSGGDMLRAGGLGADLTAR